MAAKKDTPAEPQVDEAAISATEDVDEAAGLVPKGQAVEDGDDAVGEAVESVEPPADPNAPPAPITPSSPDGAHQARVLYEDGINAGAAAFAEQAKAAYIEAAINGQTVSITTSDPEE